MFSSLRVRLIVAVALPMALVAALDAWMALRSAQDTARIVQERMLVGAARFIGEQVHLEEGVVQADVPPAALELFASPSRDHVFYRIASADGQTLAGYFDLPSPRQLPGADGAVRFYDTVLRDQPVHAVAFQQPVFAAPERGPVLIQIGQTLEGRNALAREIWAASIGGHVTMMVLGLLVLWFGIRIWLRPLLDLRDQLAAREPGALAPLDPVGVPDELGPLVDVVNEYVGRLDAHVSAQERFIADASHQLRTPLTILNTQVSFALQPHDGQARTQALRAIKQSVEHGVRLVNQLLAFDRVQARRKVELARVDLVRLVADVLESNMTLAQQRSIDLGYDGDDRAVWVQADPVLLFEMIGNLVNNALRYTQAGGVVTASVLARGGEAVVEVVDNGPGIPAEARERVFERFVRLDNSRSDGCGLGLSIVRDVARHCGARVELDTPAAHRGLVARVRFPASQPAPADASQPALRHDAHSAGKSEARLKAG
ncbi:MAG: sensor histidine kinase [Ramlibacter sp.]